VAAALCIKPRGALTKKQAAKVTVLKSGWPDFTIMRQLAMRFRGLLQTGDLERFTAWLDHAQRSGIYGMQRFARMVRRDLDAVRNALTEKWSNGQTEGQINRLKTLKRAMYGRAGPELLRSANAASSPAYAARKLRQSRLDDSSQVDAPANLETQPAAVPWLDGVRQAQFAQAPARTSPVA
jgi:Transposase